MWAGYPAVALPPIRTQMESMYSVTPLSRTQQVPPFIPLRPIRLPQIQTETPHYVNGIVVGTQVAITPRNGHIPVPPVLLHVPTPVTFQRPVEIAHSSGTNSAIFQPLCHDGKNFLFPVRQQLENASALSADASGPLLVPPSPFGLHVDNYNASIPIYTPLAPFIPTAMELLNVRADTFAESPIINSNSDGITNSDDLGFPNRDRLINDTHRSCSNVEYLHGVVGQYKVLDLAFNKENEFDIDEYCLPTAFMEIDETSVRVPLYERTGVQTVNAVPAFNISETGWNYLSDSALDNEEESNRYSPLEGSPLSRDSDTNSFYSNTNTESSSFLTQNSPLYSMVSNVDDLKRTARGEGAEQLITISIEDCNLPKENMPSTLVENHETSLGGLYFCGISRFDLHAEKSATLKENMEKVVVDMVASGLKFAVLAIRREQNLLRKVDSSYEHWQST